MQRIYHSMAAKVCNNTKSTSFRSYCFHVHVQTTKLQYLEIESHLTVQRKFVII